MAFQSATHANLGLHFGLASHLRVHRHLDGAWTVQHGDDDEGDLSTVVSTTEYFPDAGTWM